jgi:glycosyltransferase involved in cell wall biosynthesis
MPLISIGLPVFNGETYLSETIDSILEQTFKDFEIIISDNASTDRTAEICNEYALKDRRIRYYRNNKNLGAAANYNLVFYLSKAKYFKWHAYDDLCAPESLEHCVKILETLTDVVLCYPKTILIDENGKRICKYEDKLDLRQERPHDRLANLLWNLNLSNPIFGLIRSDTLRKTRLNGPYVGSDYILLMELCLLGKYYELQEYLFFRRDHEKNIRKMTVLERGKWFDPNYKKSILGHHMKILFEIFKAVSYINLDAYEKMLCYMQIRHWEIRRWRAKGGKFKAKIKERLFSSIIS